MGYLLEHAFLLRSSRAGVAGLTTALLLSKNKNYQIVVAAKHMPGDHDIEYASPWAGANYMRMSLYSTPLGNDMLMAKQPFPSEALRPRHGTGIHGQCSRTLPEITPSRAFTSRVRRLHLVVEKWRGDVDM
jgi:hypothetical protein